MIKRHEDSLMARIDALAWQGYCEIKWWELRAWYGMERLTKNVWKDIVDRFDELMDEESTIRLLERPDGVLLISGSHTTAISEKM